MHGTNRNQFRPVRRACQARPKLDRSLAMTGPNHDEILAMLPVFVISPR